MADIFSEISEDLRSENLAKIAKKYGKYILGVVFITLIAVGVYTAQKNASMRKKERTGDVFFSGIDHLNAKKQDLATANLVEVVGKNVGGYSQLAGLLLGKIHLEADNKEKAIASYEATANLGKSDKALEQLALLNATYLQMQSGKIEDKEIDKRLDQLSATNAPWRHFALELKAYRYIQKDQDEEARKIFNQLKSDLSSPEGIRKRSEQLAALPKYEK